MIPIGQAAKVEIKSRFGLSNGEALAVDEILGIVSGEGRVPRGLARILKKAGLKSPYFVVYRLERKGVISRVRRQRWLAVDFLSFLRGLEDHPSANGNGKHEAPAQVSIVEENGTNHAVSCAEAAEAAKAVLHLLNTRADLEGAVVIDSSFLHAVREKLELSVAEMYTGFAELEKSKLVSLQPRRPTDDGPRVRILSFSPKPSELDVEIQRLDKLISEAQETKKRYEELRKQMNGEE